MWRSLLYFILGEIVVFAVGYGLTMQFPESSPQIWYFVAACATALMVAIWLRDRILDYLHRKFRLRIKGAIKFNAPEMIVSVGKKRAKKPTFLLTLRRYWGKLFR